MAGAASRGQSSVHAARKPLNLPSHSPLDKPEMTPKTVTLQNGYEKVLRPCHFDTFRQ